MDTSERDMVKCFNLCLADSAELEASGGDCLDLRNENQKGGYKKNQVEDDGKFLLSWTRFAGPRKSTRDIRFCETQRTLRACG